MAIYKRGKTWWADYYDAHNKRQRKSLRTHKKINAERLHAELLVEVQRERLGLEARAPDAQGSLKPHWLAFQAELRQLGLTDQHVRETLGSVQRFLCERQVVSLGQLTLAEAEAWLRSVASAPPQRGHARDRTRRVSARTVNKHRAALRRFGRWLVRSHRLRSDPWEALRTAPAGDPRHERRPLTEREFAALVAAAPPYRALVYRVHALTGLRRAEVARLEWRDLDLGSGVLSVRPSAAKNKKAARLPLHPELLHELRSWRAGELELGWYSRCQQLAQAGKKGRDLVFPVSPTLASYRRDLAQAGVAYETEQGYADLHSLRVKFGTDLALADVPLALTQKLLRHSDPSLTANVYTKAGIDAYAEAVGRLAGHATVTAG